MEWPDRRSWRRRLAGPDWTDGQAEAMGRAWDGKLAVAVSSEQTTDGFLQRHHNGSVALAAGRESRK